MWQLRDISANNFLTDTKIRIYNITPKGNLKYCNEKRVFMKMNSKRLQAAQILVYLGFFTDQQRNSGIKILQKLI